MAAHVSYRRRLAHHVSRRGALLVAAFEGFSATPYRDAVGVLTIGFGHTRGVHEGMRWTRRHALRVLRLELDTDYGAPVRALEREIGVSFTAPMFDALASFVYNLGPGVIASGTTIGRDLRAHNWRAAADAMLAYDHAGGRVLLGLLNRRKVERRLFLHGVGGLEARARAARRR